MTGEVAKSLLTSIPHDMRSLFALDRLDTAHPANHYLNGDTLGKLMDLARLYKQVYFPFDPVLRLNDASLERGGLFDLGALWAPPHHEHRRGVVIDVRANGSATAIPQRNFEDFQVLMGSLGISWLPENLNQVSMQLIEPALVTQLAPGLPAPSTPPSATTLRACATPSRNCAVCSSRNTPK